MTSEEHPFRWVPSLQHMAEVKIIETLWRNCEVRKKLRKILPETDYRQAWPSWIPRAMSGQIRTRVDVLLIPESLKIDLKYPVKRMVINALEWLRRTQTDNPHLNELHEERTEALRYFIDNLCFNNFGCVDGRKTLESYVKDKETVGYWVWHELCLYCIEDKIVKFSEKFNWQDCSDCLNWHCSVYWYRKIHRELPPYKMMTSSSYLLGDKAGLFGAFFNGENYVRSMLEALITKYNGCRSVAAIVHLQNQLNNDEEFNKLVADSLSQFFEVGEVLIYLLRTRPTGTWLEPIANSAEHLLRKLTQWPWILFINDWKRMFETNISAVFFMAFFHWMGLAIDEMQGRYKVVLYKVFERIVRIFHDRFISNTELITKAFWRVFFKKNAAYMCTLMLDGLESDQRKFVIRGMRRYVHMNIRDDADRSIRSLYNFETSPFILLSSFQETGNEVFSDEERAFFWETYDQYYLEIR